VVSENSRHRNEVRKFVRNLILILEGHLTPALLCSALPCLSLLIPEVAVKVKVEKCGE
jgi:hypothetical protein